MRALRGAVGDPDGRPPWPARLTAVYPPRWRQRYGGELDQLVSDLAGGGRRPLAMAVDLLRGAAVAWITERGTPMTERTRSALITVLWSWVAFAATAAWFGHDLAVYPTARVAAQLVIVNQIVPDSYRALMAAGALGVAATAVAAVVFAVDAARSARRQRRPGPFILMAAPIVIAACWVGGLALLPQANGTPAGLAISVGWLLLGLAGLAAATQAVVKVVRSTEFTPLTWRIGGAAATIVTAVMVIVTCATIAWGVAEQTSTPHPGDASNWLVVTAIMAVTSVRAALALAGTRRAAAAPAASPAAA